MTLPNDRRLVLMPVPISDAVDAALDAAFEVYRPYRMDDPQAEVAALAPRIEAIASGPHSHVDAADFDRFPTLELVASFGVGYDHIDAAEAGRRGVIVTHTPDVLTEEVADTALGLLLMTVRELSAAERYLRAGRWIEDAYPLTGTLRGRRVGIAGLGRVGRAVARRLEAFGLPIAYYGRKRQDVPYPYYDDLTALARDVDILISILPGGEETFHAIGREVLEGLGSDGVLISLGRGSVVDEAALVEALQQGTIHAAGLDVFAHEPDVPPALLELPRVVLLPHVGSASHSTRAAMGQRVVDNLLAWARNEPPLSPVPETPFRGWKRRASR